MHTVRNFLFAAMAAGLVMACSVSTALSAPRIETVTTAVASTMQALTSAPRPGPAGLPFSYQHVSFVIPGGLATGVTPQTVPANNDPAGGWTSGPEHISFKLDGYNVPANSFWLNRIDIYPAEEYGQQNTTAGLSLKTLRHIVNDPTAVLDRQTLPKVPDFNATSVLAAQIQLMSFASGHGVRSVAQYAQAVMPVANSELFYHFEGLTDDGKYYIIAVLPVRAPVLQDSSQPGAPLPEGGIPFPGPETMGQQKVYDDYFSAVTDKLNATTADRFTPSLFTLDSLIQSITVK